MKEKTIITFAGAVGSSKSPIATYLSWKLNLPIFNNDSIRSEVIEDMGTLDEQEYLKRRDERLKDVLQLGRSFILDASVDRAWDQFQDMADKAGFRACVISLDLSKDLLVSLWEKKGYHETLEQADELVADHDLFLEKYGDVVDLHIEDHDFKDRLRLSYEFVQEFLKI